MKREASQLRRVRVPPKYLRGPHTGAIKKRDPTNYWQMRKARAGFVLHEYG